MTLKYLKKGWLFLFLLLAFLKSLNMVFIAYIVQWFINLTSSSDYSKLLKLVGISFAGMLLFLGISLLYQKVRFIVIQKINLFLKTQVSESILLKGKTPSKSDRSFLVNDLKQLETARIDTQLSIVYQFFTFINAIIAGLTTSFSLSLVFIITSLVPLAIQPLFNKTITNRSKQWQEENTNYTEKVNELIDSYPVSTLYNAQGSIIKRFKLTAKVMENALKRMNQSSNYANELMTTVAYLVSMIIPYAFGVYLSMRNIITIGTLMMISQLSNNFVNPLLFINQYINQIKTTKEIWKKCEAAVNEVSSKPKVVENTPKFANLMLTNGQFKIKDKTIFSDVSLQVNEYDKILLMATGSMIITSLPMFTKTHIFSMIQLALILP